MSEMKQEFSRDFRGFLRDTQVKFNRFSDIYLKCTPMFAKMTKIQKKITFPDIQNPYERSEKYGPKLI